MTQVYWDLLGLSAITTMVDLCFAKSNHILVRLDILSTYRLDTGYIEAVFAMNLRWLNKGIKKISLKSHGCFR